MAPNAVNLRSHLRSATSGLHDKLDASMRPASDWRSRSDYARFLTVQYQARLPIEAWLAMFAPADLKPPEQTPLLARDLAALGAAIPGGEDRFAIDWQGTATALGVAWVLAGSSLGNRSMLHDMQRALSHDPDRPHGVDWPREFLSSTAMTQFWKGLKGPLEEPALPQRRDPAGQAARDVFAHFLAHARAEPRVDMLEIV